MRRQRADLGGTVRIHRAQGEERKALANNGKLPGRGGGSQGPARLILTPTHQEFHFTPVSPVGEVVAQ